MPKQEEIKNPWCTYNYGFGSGGFGRVVQDKGSIVYIQYTENQKYNYEPWEAEWVFRFKTLEEAVINHIKNNQDFQMRNKNPTNREIMRLINQKFPSYFQD